MLAQRLSISLSEDSANFIEKYRRSYQVKSRSEVIARALALLQQQELEQAYREAAADEKEFEGFDNTVSDGLDDEAW